MKKCFRPLFAAVLALSMLLSMISPAFAAGTKYPASNAIQKSIEQQVRTYAQSINRSGADDTAALALATHGVTGRGKTLKMGGTHALVATLMNSQMGLTTIIRGCMMGIAVMQQKQITSVFNDAGCNYDAKLPIYYTTIYASDEITLSERLYNGGATNYEGTFNTYDDSLMWIVGSTEIHMYFTRKAVTVDTITYEVSIDFEDQFDFDSTSSSMSEEVASLIGSVLFRGFDWVATTKFQITVPNECSHQGLNYHLIYDASKTEFVADTTNGFAKNNAQKLQYLDYNNQNQKWRTYYHFERALYLRHDKPWVMEYTVSEPARFVLAESNKLIAGYPYFDHQRNMKYLLVPIQTKLSDGTTQTYYYGLSLYDKFAYHAADSYTLRLENRLNGAGSNMLYLSVYNETKKEIALQPTAMSEHYVQEKSSYVLQSSDSGGLSGVDFSLGYIGDIASGFEHSAFDLKVWENGIDGGGDYFTQSVATPTCAAEGGICHTCVLCGYSYLTDTVPALEHRWGAWQQVAAPTCTADGKEQRKCADCGFIESRVLPAAGHSYEPVVIPATCTAGGRTTYTCHCGDSFSDNEIAPLGHDISLREIMAAPTCTQEGQEQLSCSRCSYSEVHTLPATGHRYEAVVTQPTCTKQGYTTYTCRCGLSYVGDYTAATGHRYEAVITAPTCTTRGKVTQVCPCGMSYVSAHLPATGHSYENGICTGCGIGDPNAAALTVEAADAIAYTVSGNIVTVSHNAACKVGYLADDVYVKVDAIANGDGSYRFEIPAGITDVLLIMHGDVNGDGRVNAADKARLNAALLKKIPLNAQELFGADVNQDGKLLAVDKARLNAALLGKTAFDW